jgi:hypothetical protein
MNLAEFEAIATLISSREPAKSAARRVLVDGVENIEAAREFLLSRQSVSNTVGRFRSAETTILGAYSRPSKYLSRTSSNVYNVSKEAAHDVLSGRGNNMSRFIRINDSPNPEYATMLNLDHVSKVTLSPEIHMLGTQKSDKVYLALFGVDGHEMKKLDFETREAATRWVLQHLGIEL